MLLSISNLQHKDAPEKKGDSYGARLQQIERNIYQ